MAQGSPQFALTSPSANTLAPFCLGYAFRKGDVPAGQGVVGSLSTMQVTPKNRWPDGSLKFAVIAGRATLAANTPLMVTLSPGSEPTAAALTIQDLKATNITASIDCGAFGSVAWSEGDWDGAFQAWVSGPEMSSWIYRKPVGTDRHLVGWLEVRLFAGGAVEVLPWIENGYIRVAGATSKSATYSFTLGGTQRVSVAIDLPSRSRTPLISGSALSYWLGTDPQVVPKHDTAYLQATNLVPSYRASVTPSASVVTGLASTYKPLQIGNIVYSGDAMGATGYGPSIGLLPEWDVLYLTTTAPAAYGGVVRNGFSAGRYSIHYRDETTNRPLKFSAFPKLSVNASTINDYPVGATGTAAPGWDVPHHPSLGYMAYLITGRWYFMEETQFVATYNYLFQVDNLRQFAGGVFLSYSGAATTRGAAWSVRSLAQAATATPDSDALAAEFLNSLAANVDFNHARYVAQSNNPFGFVQPYGDYTGVGDGIYYEASWQQDFYVAAFGYAKALDLGIPSASKTRLTEFFAWKARSVVGRFGGPGDGEYLYRDAAVYTIAVAPTDSPDFAGGKGPWHADWGAVYRDTFKGRDPGPKVEGGLRGGNFPEASSYWGNLQPALAYAVQHGVAGAADAYDRMINATNWAELRSGFNEEPVWSVQPAIR